MMNKGERASNSPIGVNVVEGKIVVVPQFVLHFSPPNKSTKKKRIISWDMELIPA